jgi:hypothetical protein
MKTTIELAREAGNDDLFDAMQVAFLERFAALVRADEQEKYKWDVHSCGPTCKRYGCVAMREAVEAEREACAKVCDDYFGFNAIADAIRARGETK